MAHTGSYKRPRRRRRAHAARFRASPDRNSGPPLKNGVVRRRLFLIVGLMKGHVGGGPGVRWPLGVECRTNQAVPGSPSKLASMVGQCPNMHTMYIVQERLPEMPASSWVFPRVVVGHKLESLILAQNERWRHA